MESYNNYIKNKLNNNIEVNDYLIIDNDIYLVVDNSSTIQLINLSNNKMIEKKTPFNYIKIDGNDPEILKKYYLKIKK